MVIIFILKKWTTECLAWLTDWLIDCCSEQYFSNIHNDKKNYKQIINYVKATNKHIQQTVAHYELM